MSDQNLNVVILAAGKGTRMRSNRAKVLHEIAGRSMLAHVIDTVNGLAPDKLAVVVGHQADEVRASVAQDIVWVDQAEQKGTGHAVKLALEVLPEQGVTLVLYGDVPLVSGSTLEQAVAAARTGEVGLVTAQFDDPAQLGRIVRGPMGSIERIVEFKDASDAERGISEINSGIVAVPTAQLHGWLQQVTPNNAQGEYYLTDIIEMAVADEVTVQGIVATDPDEVIGVNDRLQLAQLERIHQRTCAEALMRDGATLADPDRLDVRGEVTVGADCFIDINVVFEGAVTLGDGVHVGPGCVISNSSIGDGAQINPHTLIDQAQIGPRCAVGPFARVRPGTVLAEEVRIGNFVETKKTSMGRASKANHLAYLGDATIGEDCNIGAGTITCNYDGIDKHPTTIGDGVFVGTNSTLVAPISIDDNGFVAAGSTVTVKVGSDQLAVGRAKQRNISGWVRPDRRNTEDS